MIRNIKSIDELEKAKEEYEIFKAIEREEKAREDKLYRKINTEYEKTFSNALKKSRGEKEDIISDKNDFD